MSAEERRGSAPEHLGETAAWDQTMAVLREVHGEGDLLAMLRDFHRLVVDLQKVTDALGLPLLDEDLDVVIWQVEGAIEHLDGTRPTTQ